MKTRKYYRVIIHAGTPVKYEGIVMLLPNQLKFYAQALGCKLMRHLPPELKGKDSK